MINRGNIPLWCLMSAPHLLRATTDHFFMNCGKNNPIKSPELNKCLVLSNQQSSFQRKAANLRLKKLQPATFAWLNSYKLTTHQNSVITANQSVLTLIVLTVHCHDQVHKFFKLQPNRDVSSLKEHQLCRLRSFYLTSSVSHWSLTSE